MNTGTWYLHLHHEYLLNNIRYAPVPVLDDVFPLNRNISNLSFFSSPFLRCPILASALLIIQINYRYRGLQEPQDPRPNLPNFDICVSTKIGGNKAVPFSPVLATFAFRSLVSVKFKEFNGSDIFWSLMIGKGGLPDEDMFDDVFDSLVSRTISGITCPIKSQNAGPCVFQTLSNERAL